MVVNNITIEILDDDVIKIENFSGQKYRVAVANPEKKYNGYVNFDFHDANWITTQPKNWPFSPTNEKVKVYLVGQDHMYTFDLTMKDKKIEDTTDDSMYVENFDPKKRKVSFVVPAYGTEEYIDETIESILNMENEFTIIEIVIGIDGDQKILERISDRDYPDNVKFYLFETNVGLFHVKNTMVTKTKYENIIFFDSDDVAHKDLLTYFFKNIRDNDIVRWKSLKFNDENNLTKNVHFLGGCFGIKKNVFYENNGFLPWRCHADSEFIGRVDPKYKTVYLDEHLFYYRTREDSLSNHSNTKQGSLIRETYKRIMEDKINTGNFVNPERLYTSECIFIK